ncbi:MAG: ABC transporter permease [Phycisphaerae bacterium]|nr:ABC transporter permease [Phycisphaerae bacterium]
MEERTTIGLAERRRRRGLHPAAWAQAVRDDVIRLVRGRFVVGNLAGARLKVRYQRSVLGFLWAVLTPMLMIAVLSIVFGYMLRREVDRFPVYLFSGLVPYQFFAGSLKSGGRSLVSGYRIMSRFRVQPFVLPLSEVLVNAFNLLLELLALLGMLVLAGSWFPVVAPKLSASIIVLPVGVILLFIFTLGIVLMCMTLVTYYRDVEHVIAVVTRALYFMTGIIIPPTLMGEADIFVYANPLWYHLQFFRGSLWQGTYRGAAAAVTWPDAQTWIIAVVSALASFTLGYVVYKKYEHEYVYRL